MIWFSARALIHFWFLKGGHLYGTRRLLHSFWETAKCAKQSCKVYLRRIKRSGKGTCCPWILPGLNDQPSNRQLVDWDEDHCFCNEGLSKKLKEDQESRLMWISMYSSSAITETESGHILEKGRLLVYACLPNRGPYWYVRAYSIGALIILDCACLLDRGASWKERAFSIKVLLGKGTLIILVCAYLLNRGAYWKRGAYWYVRAFSIGALIHKNQIKGGR